VTSPRPAVAGLLAVLLLLGACTPKRTAANAAPNFRPGAAGIGDPYFPKYGNGGYDVAGYDLTLRYDPKSGQLSGTAAITAMATQDLSRFDFDFAHLAAGGVVVDGRTAQAKQDGDELVVTPAAGIVKGKQFTAVVTYAGKPQALRNMALGVGGWLRTTDGAFALGQPESASTWYPVNDHPADKATFKLAITVPDGLEALSNGVPGPRSSANGWTTWTWSEAAPMASYLSTVVIGQYRVTSSTHDGKPMITAIPESLPADGPAAKSIERTGEIADFLATRFGPYPFDAYGGIVLDDSRVGYALETQSRPVYGNSFFQNEANPTVVAHELAHQWYGDSVALERWQDIWLNEGFATYAEWLWQEHDGGPSLAESFDSAYSGFDWRGPPGDPGADDLFGNAVYQRGAMTLYALRESIGDQKFAALLKSWPAAHRDGNVTTTEFIQFAQNAAGKDLGPLFQAWLFATTKPAHP
jgi:aminopeptidase N